MNLYSTGARAGAFTIFCAAFTVTLACGVVRLQSELARRSIGASANATAPYATWGQPAARWTGLATLVAWFVTGRSLVAQKPRSSGPAQRPLRRLVRRRPVCGRLAEQRRRLRGERHHRRRPLRRRQGPPVVSAARLARPACSDRPRTASSSPRGPSWSSRRSSVEHLWWSGASPPVISRRAVDRWLAQGESPRPGPDPRSPAVDGRRADVSAERRGRDVRDRRAEIHDRRRPRLGLSQCVARVFPGSR